MPTQFPIAMILVALVVLFHAPRTFATSININFSAFGADDESVNSDETAIVGTDASDTAILGAVNVSGSGWNNIRLGDKAGIPETFTAATQGGMHIDLIDDTGVDSGADLTSAGGNFFANTSTATDNATNRAAQGEGGLMQSFLLLNGNETVTISNLPSSLTANGYTAYAFFDIGVVTRTYGLTANGSPIFWTTDTTGTDSDANEDGLIDWLQATGTTAGSATTNANYAVFPGLSGSTFTITGDASVNGRSAVAGIQLVANVPEPSTALLLCLGLMALATGRWNR